MHEILNIGAWVCGILAGALWELIGLLLIAAGWVALRKWLTAARWDKVPARIIGNEVKEVRRQEGQILFQAVVHFSIVSEGREASETQTVLAGKLYPSEVQAGKLAEKYPAGKEVTARRNPRYSEEVVLESGGGAASIFLLPLGILFVAIPLAAASMAGLPAWPLGVILLAVAATAFRLDWTNRRRLENARRSGLYPAPGQGSEEDVERLLENGEKALAIHLYRELKQTDFNTARKEVDELEARPKREAPPGPERRA